MASPAKRPKCRYDFVAFTWRVIVILVWLGSFWFIMVWHGSSSSSRFIWVILVQPGSLRFNLVHLDSSWFISVRLGSAWFNIVEPWFILVHHGSSQFILAHLESPWMFIIVQHVSFWFIFVQPGSLWLNLFHVGSSWFILVNPGSFLLIMV